ncbi:membrane protein [Streptomyces daqingensis]|uniref:Membrane protein n=1 Tax=Streptomyces daqingensis TaxID=1472640 RepID=A0ABQ2MHL7_9ACTN|nr:FtsX-like permease family protein [Streptomyces daqingensis]GGO51940.1 membrane protein [Streptomyces daqingensis]
MSAGTATREGAPAPVEDGSGPGDRPAGRARPADWGRDLAMGARFATSGGRQGWTRTLLTAVGVALGVAVLLLAAAVPQIAAAFDAREEARSGGLGTAGHYAEPTEKTVLTKNANTHYRGTTLYGRLLQADGSSPVRPPGLGEIPAAGELVVSPALKELLESPEGRALAKRLDGRVTGTIEEDGLLGPAELAFYKGADDLSAGEGADRVEEFGAPESDERPLDPALVLLIVVACTVLIMPVAVFIATAVRFGGEQRDARLAALRLVGADAATTRRMAAGEALVGALLGVLLGGWFFLLGRVFVGRIELFGFSVHPADVAPSLGLGALIVVAVPVTSVAVTIFALRGVAIEPLGLVRKSEQRPRRLWWRLVPPAAGAALLLPLAGSVAGEGASVSGVQITAAVVLLLGGVALLLPWLVERIVGWLRGGPVSWQLATRRLQLSSGNASRAVSGITIAVAGAIALQMLFSAVEADQTVQDESSAEKGSVVNIYGTHATVGSADTLTAQLRRTDGVREAVGYLQAYQEVRGSDDGMTIAVGHCATLRRIARIDDCREGEVYKVPPEEGETGAPPAGTAVLGEDGKQIWRTPRARTVEGIEGPEGGKLEGLLATPSAVPVDALDSPNYQAWVVTDHTAAALEKLRTAVFRADPAYNVFERLDEETSAEFVTIRRAVLAAAVAVLLLIGASMAVSMVEQLRERKRQLSVLVAFGTRRSTLSASVLWQTAVPVVLGIGLAVVFGLGLGWGLLRLMKAPAGDWLVFLPVAGAGAGVIGLVTLVSLPFLWRMMRPDGLRTE